LSKSKTNLGGHFHHPINSRTHNNKPLIRDCLLLGLPLINGIYPIMSGFNHNNDPYKKMVV
jgi:hypothetical protein